jgi:hypothetical protein
MSVRSRAQRVGGDLPDEVVIDLVNTAPTASRSWQRMV